MAGSNWANSQDGLLWLKSAVSNRVKLGQMESAWVWVKLGHIHINCIVQSIFQNPCNDWLIRKMELNVDTE